MMLAIHVKSGGFANSWVAYCRKNGIPFREVDCFASNIMEQLRGCTALLWHWRHNDYRAALSARQLIASVETMGVRVFPDTPTSWHYDDKLGQKYLLEAIGAPLIPTHVFYDSDTALAWLQQAKFPLVWKLRSGAGSQNVRLVHTLAAARKIVARSFGRGWKPVRLHALRERLWHFRKTPNLRGFVDIGRGIVRTFVPHEKDRNLPIERNYVYFQDFVPQNDSDIRVVVIGKRAFGIRRMVREGDFRASGSGVLKYDRAEIPLDCVALAFQTTSALSAQACAFDFVRDVSGWKIVEISYAFTAPAYYGCPGWWDSDLNWHDQPVRPEIFMIEDLLTQSSFAGELLG
ncbi:hypothetical protein O9Z70_13360 [Devosia sp. YIM 151766]|uniref:ATP-grasp domain-containing protein n=1 Tax=Devosia sp. YIM 151766 TaxID=3017325 RepID=UPI00255C8CA0|nr:hypothetical protein [Devosia sp. YIM 151766]WIY52437.1 hypothetical protein O9Z70_13360 [Devosia sp. YIM 151766]